MDFIEIISGRIILEFFGASIRFFYSNLGSLLNNNDFITFSSIWSPTGSNKKKDESSSLNHMIGVILFGLFIISLIIFNV